MTEETKASTFRDLAAKGDGILVRRSGVWTYPAAETDRSGTNVQLPVEYVSDAEVQQALRDGDMHPTMTAIGGEVLSVRIKGDGEVMAALSVTRAGTPEAGTELPPNSRPEHDAGSGKQMTVEEIDRSFAAQAKAMKAEGSETTKPQPTGRSGGAPSTTGNADKAR